MVYSLVVMLLDPVPKCDSIKSERDDAWRQERQGTMGKWGSFEAKLGVAAQLLTRMVMRTLAPGPAI